MKADRHGSGYSVTVTEHEVVDFMASWPASGLTSGASYEFSYKSTNGDILDISKTVDGIVSDAVEDEGSALLALSEDAGRFGARFLGLEDVLAVRYPSAPTP